MAPWMGGEKLFVEHERGRGRMEEGKRLQMAG